MNITSISYGCVGYNTEKQGSECYWCDKIEECFEGLHKNFNRHVYNVYRDNKMIAKVKADIVEIVTYN